MIISGQIDELWWHFEFVCNFHSKYQISPLKLSMEQPEQIVRLSNANFGCLGQMEKPLFAATLDINES